MSHRTVHGNRHQCRLLPWVMCVDWVTRSWRYMAWGTEHGNHYRELLGQLPEAPQGQASPREQCCQQCSGFSNNSSMFRSIIFRLPRIPSLSICICAWWLDNTLGDWALQIKADHCWCSWAKFVSRLDGCQTGGFHCFKRKIKNKWWNRLFICNLMGDLKWCF